MKMQIIKLKAKHDQKQLELNKFNTLSNDLKNEKLTNGISENSKLILSVLSIKFDDKNKLRDNIFIKITFNNELKKTSTIKKTCF